MENILSKIQSEIKVPKGQMNKFGGYKYRSCEDIVEAAKPVLNKYGFSLTLTDEIVMIGNRFYVKSTASISGVLGALSLTEVVYSSTAFAREEESKKGMDGAQITGSASSYARKYALNGLFAIDDTKDADATNTHEKDNGVAQEDKELLKRMVFNTDMTTDEKEQAMAAIDLCGDYDRYQKIQHRLEERQQAIDTMMNPSQKDISKHLKKTVKA